MGLCTTELVMFVVAMECHGDRFRTSDHSTVSLELLKESLFNSAQEQLPDDTRSPRTTESSVSSSMKTTGAKGDDDMCGVDRPTLSTS